MQNKMLKLSVVANFISHTRRPGCRLGRIRVWVSLGAAQNLSKNLGFVPKIDPNIGLVPWGQLINVQPLLLSFADLGSSHFSFC